jgi:multidrug efflux pump subunit AcrA (membrane-fusion protein)
MRRKTSEVSQNLSCDKRCYRQKNFCIRLARVVLFGVLILMLSGCSFYPDEDELLSPPLVQPEKVSYDLIDLKKSNIERNILCTGTFSSALQRDVFFKFRGGRLKNVYVKPGDKVSEGQLLAELDTDGLSNQIKEQENKLNKAIINFNQSSKIGKLEIKSAEIQLDGLKYKYKKSLEQKDKISEDILTELNNQIKQQEIVLEKLYANYGKADGDKGFVIEQAEESVKEERTRLEGLKQEFEKARLLSPISGDVISVENIKPGDNISAFQSIVRIADPKKLQLLYAEEKIIYFYVGNKVEVTINGKTFQGEVVENTIDRSKGAVEKREGVVKIQVDNLTSGISIGDKASIKLTLEKKENVIVLPNRIIKNFSGRKYVLVLKNGKRSERDVEVGIITDTEAEIVKGLSVGDKVIEN